MEWAWKDEAGGAYVVIEISQPPEGGVEVHPNLGQSWSVNMMYMDGKWRSWEEERYIVSAVAGYRVQS
jgi:hypothetical protein